MTEKKWIALVLFLVTAAPLHWLAMKWLAERHAYCRDGFVTLDQHNTADECEFPEQRLSFEHGISHIIAVCRCNR